MKIKSLALGVAGAIALGSSAFADRGSDGNVGIIYWQAPSILNPYLSGGTKDIDLQVWLLKHLQVTTITEQCFLDWRRRFLLSAMVA